MHHRHHQLNVAHTLPAHLLFSYFHTTAVANNTLVTDTLVLTAGTFIVFYRPEYPFAE